MHVDNELYNRLADTWWDDNGVLNLLRSMTNPARFSYFREVLQQQLAVAPHGPQALDIGCGGGLLAEEFARLGCRVTGVDPSAESIAIAQAHSTAAGLDIAYQVGAGESLPFPDESFEIAYCCDVLEHVSDLEQVIKETARVLKPGGIYFFDTINRTLMSNLFMIKLGQDWQWTAIMPPRLHVWSQFIKPPELIALLRRHGIASRELVGLGSTVKPLAALRNVRQLKRGQMTFAEYGRRSELRQIKDMSMSYMGYGLKA